MEILGGNNKKKRASKIDWNDPKQRKEYFRDYGIQHRTTTNAKAKKWRQENPLRVAANKKRHRERNRTKILAQEAAYRDRNRERLRISTREWHRLHAEKGRNSRLKSKYGITSQIYNDTLAAQGGDCKICGGPTYRKHFDVDHDHYDKRFRGLLCQHCNKGLGAFRDRPEFLQAAAVYLLDYYGPNWRDQTKEGK